MMPLGELAEFPKMKELLVRKKDKISLSGCVDSQKVHMMAGLGDRFKYKIILTFSDLRAREIAEDYMFYDRNVMTYPAKDLIFYQADVHGNELTVERVKTLKRIIEGKPVTVKDVNGKSVTLSNGNGGHMWSIKSVKGDKVTIVNPWDSSKEITVSKDEIAKYVTGIETYKY